MQGTMNVKKALKDDVFQKIKSVFVTGEID